MPSSTEVRVLHSRVCQYLGYNTYEPELGHEAGTNKKVAIKKIKVGQFKDGLDMSAIREVKYLRELQHQNVIAVRPLFVKLELESQELIFCSCA